jgi:hypothetical protein
MTPQPQPPLAYRLHLRQAIEALYRVRVCLDDGNARDAAPHLTDALSLLRRAEDELEWLS